MAGKGALAPAQRALFPAGMVNKKFTAGHPEYSFVSPADNAGIQIDLPGIG
jgi:hypothetical protein